MFVTHIHHVTGTHATIKYYTYIYIHIYVHNVVTVTITDNSPINVKFNVKIHRTATQEHLHKYASVHLITSTLFVQICRLKLDWVKWNLSSY